MGNITFEWDPLKARKNLQKHGVSFEEARSTFFDESARIIPDPEHSLVEERFVLLGYSLAGRCLIVCHCCRQSEKVVRLISARRASPAEEQSYWRYR